MKEKKLGTVDVMRTANRERWMCQNNSGGLCKLFTCLFAKVAVHMYGKWKKSKGEKVRASSLKCDMKKSSPVGLTIGKHCITSFSSCLSGMANANVRCGSPPKRNCWCET